MSRKSEIVKRTAIAVAVLTMVFVQTATAATNTTWRTPTYTLLARQMPVREMFNAFAVAQGVSVVMGEAVSGVLSGDFRTIPSQEFLERVCAVNNFTWYFDGATLFIYGAGETTSVFTDLAYLKADEVEGILREFGILDERFPIKSAAEGEMLMVSGPPRYVELVVQAISRADQLKEMRTFSEVETRIFPLKNTWADSVSLSVSGPESTTQIKGVAQLLQEMMGHEDEGLVRDAAESNRVADAESKVLGFRKNAIRPIISADNRMNAVVVRDAKAKMPTYERLIREFDQPLRLVEIAITTLEMSRNDALNWQLSLGIKAVQEDLTGTVGQNLSGMTAADALVGRGFAGALTYLGKDTEISASLSAQREKGLARNISRTTLLTMDNMTAEITDTQSYHARCVGQEVATLEEVSAGTKLAVKPRIATKIVDGIETNQIWLTVQLQDGGFESISVDSMPVTRDSTLQTQAAIGEGQSLMLAGYLRDIRDDERWGIPLLRDLPLIGWIFGGYSRKDETIQRIFILTPYVVDPGMPSVTRIQASRARDISEERELEKDKDDDDLTRSKREAEFRHEYRSGRFLKKEKTSEPEMEPCEAEHSDVSAQREDENGND